MKKILCIILAFVFMLMLLSACSKAKDTAIPAGTDAGSNSGTMVTIDIAASSEENPLLEAVEEQNSEHAGVWTSNGKDRLTLNADGTYTFDDALAECFLFVDGNEVQADLDFLNASFTILVPAADFPEDGTYFLPASEACASDLTYAIEKGNIAFVSGIKGFYSVYEENNCPRLYVEDGFTEEHPDAAFRKENGITVLYNEETPERKFVRIQDYDAFLDLTRATPDDESMFGTWKLKEGEGVLYNGSVVKEFTIGQDATLAIGDTLLRGEFRMVDGQMNYYWAIFADFGRVYTWRAFSDPDAMFLHTPDDFANWSRYYK